jgi:hypothetical protein
MSSLVIRYAMLKINDNMNVNEGVGIPPPLGLTRARPSRCVVKLVNYRLFLVTGGIDAYSP